MRERRVCLCLKGSSKSPLMKRGPDPPHLACRGPAQGLHLWDGSPQFPSSDAFCSKFLILGGIFTGSTRHCSFGGPSLNSSGHPETRLE